MKMVLVTGGDGFIGKNLREVLKRRTNVTELTFDVENTQTELDRHLVAADVIFHLAGVNRPKTEAEFFTGNAGLTQQMCDRLRASKHCPKIVFSSSMQAVLDNAYGKSKREAETELERFASETGADVAVHRLSNVFGKWCRPNYNSVVATFCHNIARDLPIQVSDPARTVDLTYIDDVVAAFVEEIDAPRQPGFRFADPLPSHSITLGGLVSLIQSFKAYRLTRELPNSGDPFVRALFATYLSHVEMHDCMYPLAHTKDEPGSTADLFHAPSAGRVLLVRTEPGCVRGDYFHHTTAESLLVVSGRARITLRHIQNGDEIEFVVCGEQYRIVAIPPGYAHAIKNVGDEELLSVVWSNDTPTTASNDLYPYPLECRSDSRVTE